MMKQRKFHGIKAAVVFVGFYDEHVTMKELRADIERAIENREESCRQLA